MSLLWQRAATFGDERFLLEISTHIEGSAILMTLPGGDRGDFMYAASLRMRTNLEWETSAGLDAKATRRRFGGYHAINTDARYVCQGCGVCWDDGNALQPFAKPLAGQQTFNGMLYELNELYSTSAQSAIVQDYWTNSNTGLQTFTTSAWPRLERDAEQAT
ncbi:hypothetical protein LOK82_09785 [Xylella fastidiosa subsp. multiplex]|uniref:Uncharacterized protein n=1 Tax=Xylella fastidiosa subsp. multiplex TaxID=644357 RepID=A0AAW6HY61_XYLFS|nr:hypothetical protein [Xylella fastidiosa subsp. multiplex]